MVLLLLVLLLLAGHARGGRRVRSRARLLLGRMVVVVVVPLLLLPPLLLALRAGSEAAIRVDAFLEQRWACGWAHDSAAGPRVLLLLLLLCGYRRRGLGSRACRQPAVEQHELAADGCGAA